MSIAPDPEQLEHDPAERDPAERDLAERDRATVLDCAHAAIELHQGTLQYLHGPVHVDTITCATCPTEVVLLIATDPRDDLSAHLPLGN